MNATHPHGPGAPPGAMPPGGGLSPDMMAQLGKMGMGSKQGGKGGSAGLPGMGGAGGSPGGAGKTPRPVGTPLQEVKYFAGDVAHGVLEVLPDFMQSLFGISPADKPEDAARKRQMLQRYQQMNAEQQQFVQQRTKAEYEKKQQEEARQAQAEKAKRQQQAASLPVPQGRTHGAGAGMPGQSRKKSTIDDLNKKRQQMSGVD